jgi:hypothetical protein
MCRFFSRAGFSLFYKLALTVTESISTGAAAKASCNSFAEEKSFHLVCRAGN